MLTTRRLIHTALLAVAVACALSAEAMPFVDQATQSAAEALGVQVASQH